jgi:hypothetical protein
VRNAALCHFEAVGERIPKKFSERFTVATPQGEIAEANEVVAAEIRLRKVRVPEE